MSYKVNIGLSNKHVHLSQADLGLFGEGYELTPSKPLVQPGQFAAEEKVDIVGPKKTLAGIRGVRTSSSRNTGGACTDRC